MKTICVAAVAAIMYGPANAAAIAGTPTVSEWALLTPSPEAKLVARTVYGAGYAGAAFLSNPSNKFPVTSVNGAFTVPTPKATPGGSSGLTNAWIGLDGITCKSALFNVGVAMSVTNNKPSFYAYAQWSPGAQVLFPNFPIYAGDSISLSLRATTPSFGYVNITASSGSGKPRVTSTIVSAPNPSATLCGIGGEWILESPGRGGNPPINNWNSIAFTYPYVVDLNGTYYSPTQGTEVLDIQQDGVTYSKSSQGYFGVPINYIGPGAAT